MNMKKRLFKNKLSKTEEEMYKHEFFGDNARHFTIDIFTPDNTYLTGIDNHTDKTFRFIHDSIRSVPDVSGLATRIEECTNHHFKLIC